MAFFSTKSTEWAFMSFFPWIMTVNIRIFILATALIHWYCRVDFSLSLEVCLDEKEKKHVILEFNEQKHTFNVLSFEFRWDCSNEKLKILDVMRTTILYIWRNWELFFFITFMATWTVWNESYSCGECTYLTCLLRNAFLYTCNDMHQTCLPWILISWKKLMHSLNFFWPIWVLHS